MRPLRHIGGEVDFNEVFLDGALVPDAYRVGEVGQGWKVANATLSGERADGVGRRAPAASTASAVGAWSTCSSWPGASGRDGDPVVRQELMRVYSEEQIRDVDEPARRAPR